MNKKKMVKKIEEGFKSFKVKDQLDAMLNQEILLDEIEKEKLTNEDKNYGKQRK